MVIGIIGGNCTGKSALAEALRDALGGEIVTGKDYLRMAKTEGEAAERFKGRLEEAVSGEHILYVISEREQLELLPAGAARILVTADLELIKERFRARMRGALPKPVEQMLEKRHGMFDRGEYEFRFESGKDDAAAFCAKVKSAVGGSPSAGTGA